MIRALAACLVLLASTPAQEAARYGSPHEREFDFWIGKWTVNNRALGKDGKWREAGKAQAHIRPILGGKAILEEWDGKSGGHANTFGISVRCYDPTKRRWVIVLNWPNPRYAGFGQMEGSFRHGRGEFFPPAEAAKEVPRGQRFTFSDGLPKTCRWDMAQPVADGGWRTTWIMEFTRTHSVEWTKKEMEALRPPPEKPVCTAPEARQFDKLLGPWQGKGFAIGPDGKRAPVTAWFRASSTNRGCATLCWLDVTNAKGDTAKTFTAWAWSMRAKKWVARTIDDRVPQFFVMAGTFDGETKGSFVRTDRKGNPMKSTRRVRLLDIAKAGFRRIEEVSADQGETWTTVLDVTFGK